MTKAEFVATVLKNPINAAILARLPDLKVQDAWLVSGALFQTVWNVITGRAPDYGIKDYDLFYFDSDASWAAEDVVIAKTKALLADLNAPVEIRNQARVHLWYEAKFGAPYPPLARATDGIDRFLTQTAQVGVRGLGLDVYAPHGFDDVARMIVRPNRTPNFQATLYLEKAERWKSQWPEITIIPA